jgi:ferredoxin
MTAPRLLRWVAAAEPDLVLVCDHLDPVRVPRSHVPLRLDRCVAELPDHWIPEVLACGAPTVAVVCDESTRIIDALRHSLPERLVPAPARRVLRAAEEIFADRVPLPRRALLGLAVDTPLPLDVDLPDAERLERALQALDVELHLSVALTVRDCTACGVCVKACSTGALSLIEVSESSTALLHDASLCQGDQRCVDLCPAQAITVAGSDGGAGLQTLETVPTTRCSSCRARFRGNGTELCPPCSFRAANPFGSRMPPGMAPHRDSAPD